MRNLGQDDSSSGESGGNDGNFLHLREFEQSVSELIDLPAEPLNRRELYTELLACGMGNVEEISTQLLKAGWQRKAGLQIERFNKYAEARGLDIRLAEDEMLTALLTSRSARQILQGIDKKAQKLRPRRIVSIAQLMEKLR